MELKRTIFSTTISRCEKIHLIQLRNDIDARDMKTAEHRDN